MTEYRGNFPAYGLTEAARAEQQTEFEAARASSINSWHEFWIPYEGIAYALLNHTFRTDTLRMFGGKFREGVRLRDLRAAYHIGKAKAEQEDIEDNRLYVMAEELQQVIALPPVQLHYLRSI